MINGATIGMLAQAEAAAQRLREDQTTLSGLLRLFATIDWGQFTVTRLVSSFLQINPNVTAELSLTNRPLLLESWIRHRHFNLYHQR